MSRLLVYLVQQSLHDRGSRRRHGAEAWGAGKSKERGPVTWHLLRDALPQFPPPPVDFPRQPRVHDRLLLSPPSLPRPRLHLLPPSPTTISRQQLDI